MQPTPKKKKKIMSKVLKLLTPYARGGLQLKNRVVMCPMTRSRASANGVPSEHAKVYRKIADRVWEKVEAQLAGGARQAPKIVVQ